MRFQAFPIRVPEYLYVDDEVFNIRVHTEMMNAYFDNCFYIKFYNSSSLFRLLGNKQAPACRYQKTWTIKSGNGAIFGFYPRVFITVVDYSHFERRIDMPFVFAESR